MLIIFSAQYMMAQDTVRVKVLGKNAVTVIDGMGKTNVQGGIAEFFRFGGENILRRWGIWGIDIQLEFRDNIKMVPEFLPEFTVIFCFWQHLRHDAHDKFCSPCSFVTVLDL